MGGFVGTLRGNTSLSIAITCHGCGQRFDVPDDYQRRKIRCAACGVYCEVPEPSKKSSAAKMPAKEKVKHSSPAGDADAIFADAYREEAVAKRAPEAKITDPLPASPPPLPAIEPLVTSDKDDGSPYRFADPDLRKCPDCQKGLAPDAKVCTHCGFNLETRKRPVRVYDEVCRSWESGWPLSKRLRVYLGAQAVVLSSVILGGSLFGHWGVFATPYITFTALLTFVLGTFDRLDLSRDKRGRVRLTQTWRVFFFPRAPGTINLREYEGIATGPGTQGGFMDWIVFLMFLQLGILPGVFWFFFGMHQQSFYVALTKNHGFPECMLYRGWDEKRIREIAETLHEVAELPYAG
jgi:ribosomal protein L37E